MDLGVISVRYAKALLKSALDQKQEAEVYREMSLLSESYLRVPQLRQTIDNPMLQKKQKADLLVTACGGQPSPLTSRFFDLVLKEDREKLVPFMATSYITLYRQHNNIIRGKLTTATAVSEQTEAKMKRMIEQRTQQTVEFQTEVDPSIIGGFILEYDTYSIDASVKSKLANVLNQLRQ